jgi:two-component system phosphate regulon sensor histidine kinase PhoR
LNLSKIEYRRNILFAKKYNLVNIINEVINSLVFLADQNNVKIKLYCDEDTVFFITDEELFRQMVKNIVENFIFHAGRDKKLDINLSEENNHINITFTDNGVGISKEDSPYIFQRFYRGKNPITTKTIGSGLGLSIVKHIVELHNGKISVNSKPNVKTVFKIVLPKKAKD